MYKIFDTLADYNQYTDNGTRLTAGILYIVKENKSLYFLTNNIDGETEKYEYLDEIPEGYIIPTGNIAITENGENIDVNDYATASVNVPIPEGYIIPTGNKTITQNGTNIDVNDYATATVNVDAPAKDYIVEGTEYNPTATYSGSFKPQKHIVTANIPSGFTSIGGNAFSSYESLTSVTIPDSVTSIGQQAFIYCTRLTSVTIGSGVTSIGNQAFDSCTGLTSITIPDSVTSIGQYAFSGCTGLTSITIPDSVTSIGKIAFFGCSGLTSIVVDSANTVYDSRDNCNAIINTSTNELIAGCKNTVIPDSVTSISERAFSGCTGLTSITIPNSVTSIGIGAFINCTGLTSITIPNSVTSIGGEAFRFCSVLTSVTVEATTPPTLSNTNAFNNTNANLIIYVPAESVDAYKAATNWSSYSSKIQAIPTV